MPNNTTGNNNVSSDFMRVLMALKAHTMRAIPVADLVVVTKIDGDNIKAAYLANQNTFVECIALKSLQLKVGDIALCVFTKTRFRENLAKVKAGKQPQTMPDNTEIHSRNNGVIVGVVYSKEE